MDVHCLQNEVSNYILTTWEGMDVMRNCGSDQRYAAEYDRLRWWQLIVLDAEKSRVTYAADTL